MFSKRLRPSLTRFQTRATSACIIKHFVLYAGAVLLACLVFVPSSSATVFYARDQLAELAFPGAEEVEALDFFLTDAQRGAIEKLAAAPLETSLLTVYAGKKAGQILGYAILDSHVVRTLPATFLVVLRRDGTIAATHVMAFHEPLEYLPSKRWLGLLTDHKLENDLRVGRAITAITGSTLSAHAIVGGVRRALAIYEVLLADNG